MAGTAKQDIKNGVDKIVLHGRDVFYSGCAKPARLLTGVTKAY